MKLHDEYLFDCTIDVAKKYLFDDDNIISLIPKSERFEKVSCGEYQAIIPVKVLLFKTKLSVAITFLESNKQDCRVFSGEASGKLGNASLQGEVQLFPDEEKTRLVYDIDITVLGRFADKAEQFIKESGTVQIKKGLQLIADTIDT